MKKITFKRRVVTIRFLLFFIAISKLCNAQLFDYDFVANNGCTALGVTHSVAGITCSNISFTSNVTCTPVMFALGTSPWTESTINTSKYIQFTISATSCNIINLGSFEIDQYVASGTGTWYLRSSLDNFSTNIGAPATILPLINNTIYSASITMPAAFSNLTNVTFRLYLSNASDTWVIDNLRMRGTIPAMGVNSATICSGQSATLTASGATIYLWSTGETTPSIIVSPTTSNTYTVTGTTNGCSTVLTSTVIVNTLSTLTVSASINTICASHSTSLSASGATNYTWSPSTGLSANTGANVTATPTVTTTYTVTGTNATNCSNTSSITITVKPLNALDINADGVIDTNDGNALISHYNQNACTCHPGDCICRSDLNNDGVVNINDYLTWLGSWFSNQGKYCN